MARLIILRRLRHASYYCVSNRFSTTRLFIRNSRFFRVSNTMENFCKNNQEDDIIQNVSEDKSRKSTSGITEKPDKSDIIIDDIVQIKKVPIYATVNKKAKIPKEQLQLAVIKPKDFVYLPVGSDEPTEGSSLCAAPQSVFKVTIEENNCETRKTSGTRWARFRNGLNDENTLGIYYWMSLCFILGVTFVILMILTRIPTQNHYYYYN